jgi:nucleoside-triphosphatase
MMERPTSAATLAAHFAANAPGSGELWLITGERGSDRSRWCQALLVETEKLGLSTAGVLSLPTIVRGRTVAIDLLNVRDGERRPLAILHAWPGALPAALAIEQGAADIFPTAGRWRFDPATLALANQLLREGVSVDLLVIDEIGPLEMRQQGGFKAALALLDAGSFRFAVVTIRSSLLDEARERWPGSHVIFLETSQCAAAPAHDIVDTPPSGDGGE